MRQLSTSERLAQVLHSRGLFQLEKLARAGYYDDFKSPLAMPCQQLVADLRAAGCRDLVKRVMRGEFDATREEAEEWYAREGKDLIS